MTDQFGIGWRPELASGILSNLDRIDVVEVIADDLFAAPRKLRAVQTLSRQVPVVLHGVSLGLASARAVEASRLEQMARVVDAVRPRFWSEHLAFVRGDGLEIGHLAAPPRNDASVEGSARNLERARRVVGSSPILENVATLIDPPGSSCDEATWLSNVAHEANIDLLLDLNNLHANAVNFGYDGKRFLAEIPLDRVRAVHLAGGQWIASANGERRFLDDHLHDVPDAVYDLLTELGARTAQPLTVILERDGAYPAFERLLAELGRAREALAEGRRRGVGRVESAEPRPARRRTSSFETRLEDTLARLYVDRSLRERFLRDPARETAAFGLDAEARAALARIDRAGLELAAASFARKRRKPEQSRRMNPFARWVERWCGRA